MKNTCWLETEGYQVLLTLESLKHSGNYFDVVIELSAKPGLAKFSVSSVPTFIAHKDLQNLIDYFNQHIVQLQQDPDSESPTFVTAELGFQLQAFAGEIRSAEDGEFTLRWMVNLGQQDEAASRTYVGGESVVTLEQIHQFTTSLQAVLEQTQLQMIM